MRTTALAMSLVLASLPGCSNEAEPAAAEKKSDAPAATAQASAIIDHTVESIDGSEKSLKDYRGKAVLIVNTASECGFTPQYESLQQLYGKYQDRGLVVLGFPSNDFGGQEPGTHEEIQSFVSSEYAVQFPMMAKVKTKGDGQSPLYKTLTEDTPDGMKGEVKWNFTKFLVDPTGKVVGRFESPVDPMSDEMVKAVESALPESG